MPLPPSRPDIAFIPTPADAIEAMLDLAQVTAADRLYDLGCGDGRLLIRAAQRCGCRGVGIDIDLVQIEAAIASAQQAGVGDRIGFRQENLYASDFADATVVALYLLPHLNLRLRPRLLSQLRPGTRIVSHQFDMGDWQPDRVVRLEPSEEDSTLYLWIVPFDIPSNLATT
ncbi:MAG: class I SAM-dependent methyltransferase [Cyanobacteria bacterium Co-bin8]|nr:class I SAM-dependent methyltransferase [Cyanobacteria bacterium Co-bin8]